MRNGGLCQDVQINILLNMQHPLVQFQWQEYKFITPYLRKVEKCHFLPTLVCQKKVLASEKAVADISASVKERLSVTEG